MYKQELFLLRYNNDVVCIIDKGHSPVCKAIRPLNRRHTNFRDNNELLPSYDPYIPRANPIFYNCSTLDCEQIELNSLTQVTSPDIRLKSCYTEIKDEYACETIRYNHLKNIDKVLFLSNNIKSKVFYILDCLVYTDSERVCHKKDDIDSHAGLVKSGAIVRPNDTNVLSQDELLCEENADGVVKCDVNPYVPYGNELKLKEAINTDDKVLLKRGSFVIPLIKVCLDLWCGYSGKIPKPTRRQYHYEPPGGKIYRCYYAKKQQICKEVPESRNNLMQYNWLET